MITGENISEDLYLLDKIKRGDEKAFEKLYHTYWQPLLSAAIHRLGSREIACEIIQDVFASLWQRRQELRITTGFAAYLHTALKYKVLDHIRSQKVRDRYVSEIKRVVVPFHNTTAETIAYQETNNALHRKISQLPEKCRLIFNLSRFEHLSTREIADRLHISPKTVENQIGKALRLLRLSMKEFLSTLIFLLISLF